MVDALYMSDDGRAPRQAAERSRKPLKSQQQWPCLLPSIAVAIAPLRNLTSRPEQQFWLTISPTALLVAFFEAVAASHSLGCRANGVGPPTFHRQTHPNSETMAACIMPSRS